MTMASTRSSACSLPCTMDLPASMGPPETNTTGILTRMAAFSMPGVILSQLEMHTMASAQWALTIYSTESAMRSEEHTSELQSRENLVCRLLLEKKKGAE